MSFFSRMYTELGNALSDAYGHLMHGDDAGKSVTLAFVARPHIISTQTESGEKDFSKFDLGMTFLEVNDRAYVRTVSPDSDAARAGIQPKDCVQFAAVLAGRNLAEIQDDESRATSYALQCERRGLRTSYDELRELFEGCSVLPDSGIDTSIGSDENNDADVIRKTSSTEDDHSPSKIGAHKQLEMFPSTKHDLLNEESSKISNKGHGFSVSKTVRFTTQSMVGRCTPMDIPVPKTPLSPSTQDGKAIHPVVVVFRRTRKRQLGGVSQSGMPSFRLDEECERAASLVRRLAPTLDTEPQPDAWDEIVHDATEFLLPSGSMLSPVDLQRMGSTEMDLLGGGNDTLSYYSDRASGRGHSTTPVKGGMTPLDNSIPLDTLEIQSSEKLQRLRTRMWTEALQQGTNGYRGSDDDVEAATIRGMIQKAVGLAFVRTSKVVLGVSMHGGSGIVISRLPDGTWSAPSAIGTWGLGLGIQFGLEVAEYIFILQTDDSLDHFRRGGHFTIGGNIGAAVAGIGREAYGAASIGLCSPSTKGQSEHEIEEDKFSSKKRKKKEAMSEVAPIVAYAKSQGLYFGVSLEGSRIYTRDDINLRTYKFSTGREVSAHDILTGKVPTPAEAEDLYVSLHSVEFTHEISNLPRPPERLRDDSQNLWRFDRSSLTAATTGKDGNVASPFSFLSNISEEESAEFSVFETKFKNFLYGGVSVQRLVPNTEALGSKTRRERRTLWLMLPEVGALRLGFVSKLSDGGPVKTSSKASSRRFDNDEHSEYSGSRKAEDYSTVASEDGTYDGTVDTGRSDSKDVNARGSRLGKVSLSNKYSIALTDVTLLSQESNVPIRFSSEDKKESLRVIFIKDASGTSLLFLADNLREAELLVCGLKLLLERETARLGVRGAVPITQLGGRQVRDAMSPAAARGNVGSTTFDNVKRNSVSSSLGTRQGGLISWKGRSFIAAGGNTLEYSSSENEEGEDESFFKAEENSQIEKHKVLESRKSWSQVPTQGQLREVASKLNSSEEAPINFSSGTLLNAPTVESVPRYIHGQMLIRDIATDVTLPLPLPLCRVLLLDSSSPVITKWEVDRGDRNYEKSMWSFPPSTPRELERHSSEHQLIASGSMVGAYRTIDFNRVRNGDFVKLTETQIVDADDTDKLAFTVSERMPRRGFSVKVRILLRAAAAHFCQATILAEIRPMGKNMSNQVAVHKAFQLVISEARTRYGIEGSGLLAGFLNVANNIPIPNVTSDPIPASRSPSRQSGYVKDNSQSDDSQIAPLQQAQVQVPTITSADHSASPAIAENPHRDRNDFLVPTDYPDAMKPQLRSPPQHNPPANLRGAQSTTLESSSGSVVLGSVLGQQHTPERPKSKRNVSERPPTPSILERLTQESDSKPRQNYPSNDFAEMPADEREDMPKPQLCIEVKPLPKIRLDLMPAPREEDEDNDSPASSSRHTKASKKSSRTNKSFTSKTGRRRTRNRI